VWGAWYRVQGAGCRVRGAGCRHLARIRDRGSGSGFRVGLTIGAWLQVPGFGFRFRVQGSGFRVQDSGEGLGYALLVSRTGGGGWFGGHTHIHTHTHAPTHPHPPTHPPTHTHAHTHTHTQGAGCRHLARVRNRGRRLVGADGAIFLPRLVEPAQWFRGGLVFEADRVYARKR